MDWLRVIFVSGLIMIHVAAMFDPYPITAVKGRPTFPLILFATFLHEWRLAVLFIVSGAASYFALGFLNARQFVKMRIRRIVIPLIIGTLFIVPVQLYYWQFLNNPTYNKTYLHFYFTIMYRFFVYGLFGTARETLHWAHLWFLAYLFVASLVALPLLVYLRHGKGQEFIPKLAAFVEKPWAIFLFSIPLVLVEVTLRAMWTSSRIIIIDDGATFTLNLILFIYGFIIFSNDRIRRAIEAHRWSALLGGILTSAIYLIITFVFRTPTRGYNLNWSLFMLLRGASVWFWCVAVLGFGSKYLDFNHKVLAYLNEAVYPVYVVHLPIATMIAYRLVHLPVPPLVQFTIIVIFTLAFSLLLFEVIRRTKITRFLFGLKTKKPKPAPPPPAETVVASAAPSA
jgi:surface polysaccharide O-acyltransferase-like enzyme